MKEKHTSILTAIAEAVVDAWLFVMAAFALIIISPYLLWQWVAAVKAHRPFMERLLGDEEYLEDEKVGA